MIFKQEMILADGTAVVLIHLVTLEGGREVMACAPRLRELHTANYRTQPWQRTGEPGAVTCPLCKVSDAYRRATSPPPPEGAVAVHLEKDGRTACGASGARTGEPQAVTCADCRSRAPGGVPLAGHPPTVVHYDGVGGTACGKAGFRTGEPLAVTCPNCVMTGAHRKALSLVRAALAARRACV